MYALSFSTMLRPAPYHRFKSMAKVALGQGQTAWRGDLRDFLGVDEKPFVTLGMFGTCGLLVAARLPLLARRPAGTPDAARSALEIMPGGGPVRRAGWHRESGGDLPDPELPIPQSGQHLHRLLLRAGGGPAARSAEAAGRLVPPPVAIRCGSRGDAGHLPARPDARVLDPGLRPCQRALLARPRLLPARRGGPPRGLDGLPAPLRRVPRWLHDRTEPRMELPERRAHPGLPAYRSTPLLDPPR